MAVDARQALDVSDRVVSVPALNALAPRSSDDSLVFCHLSSLLSTLALRKKVGGGERNYERPSDS